MVRKLGPVGDIGLWPANGLPDGWLRCDGSVYDPLVYSDLFAVIGSLYGTAGGVIGAWSNPASGTGSNFVDVAFSPTLNRFSALTGGTVVKYSDDGGATVLAGTALPTPTGFTNVIARAVKWSDFYGRFIAAVNADQTGGSNDQAFIYTSLDGITYTVANNGLPILPLTTLFDIEVRDNIVILPVGSGQVLRSTDLQAWTLITAIIGGGVFRGVAASPTQFAVVGDAGQLATSPDGSAGTWTTRASGTANQLVSVAYSQPLGQFLAVSSSASAGSARYSDNDGATWAAATAPSSASGTGDRVRWLGSFYLAASSTNGRFIQRDTATTAAVDVSTGAGQNPVSIATSGTRLVAVHAGGDWRTSALTLDTRLPDFVDRFPLGASATRALGTRGGSFTTGGPSATSPTNLIVVGQVADQNHTHQAVPPYQAVHFIIKAQPDPDAVYPAAFDPVAYATGNGVISYRPPG